jgi:hypothetical protein
MALSISAWLTGWVDCGASDADPPPPPQAVMARLALSTRAAACRARLPVERFKRITMNSFGGHGAAGTQPDQVVSRP